MEEAALVRNVTEFGDNALVSAYLEGNETAFEVLMTRYQGRLANYINGILHDYDRSVELCQETFIRVFRNAHRYQGKYQFSTWLYRIATNLAIDELRRRQRKGRFFLYNIMELFSRDERPMPLPDRRQSPDLTYDAKQQRLKLKTAIDSLPEKYRLAFILKEVQDLSYEETAQVLNISLGTAKSRIHRAKLLLREKLSDLL
ncbi:MAG TPA: sigma-70 family RNA polymerase sigma factor [Acidobacteriota bacterium]|nr:sigma-70 family RNA polymerase sigma factor [Acidobacteriota bacterium]